MLLMCKKCHAKAEKFGMLEAVKKLMRKGIWICPFLSKRCGKASA